MRNTKRIVNRVTLVVLAMTFGGLLATEAAAQNPFVIDGVVPANGQLTPPAPVNDPFGNVQELGAVNSNTTKVGNINTDGLPTLDFTNPNGQVDLRTVWTQVVKAADGHLWLYFAWRRDANNGSGFIAYEFQQAALSLACVYTGTGLDMVRPPGAAETALINSCNPWAGRQSGDFMILWDQSGSALDITKRVYNGASFGPGVDLDSAVAAISADGFYGEAAIDLTADVFPPEGSCISFANIIPGTVTGNSDTADYKDTVLSAFEPISNCGTVIVRKETVPAEQTGSFTYTLARDGILPINYDGDFDASDTLTFDGDEDTYTDLIAAADYTLTEDTPTSPWVLQTIVCVTGATSVDITAGGSFEVEAGETTTCTITNKRNQGSVKVIKIVVNDNGGTALASQFLLSLGDDPQTPTTFNGSAGQSFTFDEGYVFNVGELSGPEGYTMVSRVGDCEGEIVADTEKVCTITNDDQPPSLTLVKVVVNDNGGTAGITDFTLTADGPTPISGAGGATSDASFDAGTYALSETNVPGYTASEWVCVGGTQNGSNITLALGQSATCTITNNDAKAAPAGTTVQRAVLHDTLNITGIRPNGGQLTATFRLYSDEGCTAQIGADETVNVTQTGTTGTATTVLGVLVNASGVYRWKVTLSGNAFNEGLTTACGSEISAVTFTQ